MYATDGGGEAPIDYCGMGSRKGPGGRRPLLGGQDETLLIADLQRSDIDKAKGLSDDAADRRPALYGQLAKN